MQTTITETVMEGPLALSGPMRTLWADLFPNPLPPRVRDNSPPYLAVSVVGRVGPSLQVPQYTPQSPPKSHVRMCAGLQVSLAALP